MQHLESILHLIFLRALVHDLFELFVEIGNTIEPTVITGLDNSHLTGHQQLTGMRNLQLDQVF